MKTVLCSLERQMEDIYPGLAAILVMIAYFKEKEDALFLLADVNYFVLYCHNISFLFDFFPYEYGTCDFLYCFWFILCCRKLPPRQTLRPICPWLALQGSSCLVKFQHKTIHNTL